MRCYTHQESKSYLYFQKNKNLKNPIFQFIYIFTLNPLFEVGQCHHKFHKTNQQKKTLNQKRFLFTNFSHNKTKQFPFPFFFFNYLHNHKTQLFFVDTIFFFYLFFILFNHNKIKFCCSTGGSQYTTEQSSPSEKRVNENMPK